MKFSKHFSMLVRSACHSGVLGFPITRSWLELPEDTKGNRRPPGNDNSLRFPPWSKCGHGVVLAGNSSKPTKVSTGSLVEPCHKQIEIAMATWFTAQCIWQDLKEEYDTGFSYYSVIRLVYELKNTVRKYLISISGSIHPGNKHRSTFLRAAYSGSIKRKMASSRDIPYDSFSRYDYEEASKPKTVVIFIRTHEHAFEEFSGVPEVVRHDIRSNKCVRRCETTAWPFKSYTLAGKFRHPGREVRQFI